MEHSWLTINGSSKKPSQGSDTVAVVEKGLEIWR